jgi:hypothetical protein
MNCPYCKKAINAFTGLQELQKFQKHLAKCRKNPANIVVPDSAGLPENPTEAQVNQALMALRRKQTLNDALEIRAESGQ